MKTQTPQSVSADVEEISKLRLRMEVVGENMMKYFSFKRHKKVKL